MQEITNKLLSLLPSSPSKSSKKEESTTNKVPTMPTSKNKNMLSLEDEVASMQLGSELFDRDRRETDQARRESALAMVDAAKQQQKQQQPQAVTLCTPQDIASLPLLQPFNIRNTNQSTIINTIINEQHSNDSLLSVLKREEELRKELDNVKFGKSGNKKDDKKDSKDEGKDKDKETKDDSKDVAEEKDVNGRAAALSNAKSKKDKKAAKKKKLSPKEEAKVKELEMNIDAINMLVKQQRESLAQFANWTKGEFLVLFCFVLGVCCLLRVCGREFILFMYVCHWVA